MAQDLPDSFEELRKRVTTLEQNLQTMTSTITDMKRGQEQTAKDSAYRHQESRRDVKELKSLAQETLKQTQATNGRVTALEQWKAVASALKDATHPWLMAAFGMAGSVITGMILYVLLKPHA